MADGVTVFRNPTTIFGSDEWAEENLRWTRNTLRSAEADCVPVANNMPHYRAWCARHGIDWSKFCREQLEADPRWVTKIEEGVAILRTAGHTGPISKEQAVKAHAEAAKPQRTRAEAVTGQVEVGHKGFKTKEQESSGNGNDNYNVNNVGAGNSASYLASRIARDAPEVLEQMKQGAFRSVRAAAKAAGIIRDKTRLEKTQALVRRMDEQELYAFESWFDEELQRRRA